MLQHLIDLDTNIYLFFNSMHSELFDRYMMLLTGKYAWGIMYLTLFYLIFKQFGWRKGVVVTITVVLSIVLADQLCATVIRPVVERLRPSHVDNPLSALAHIVDGYRGGNYGFPSCHAANSFALATILSLFCRQTRFVVFIFFWAFVHSYTRLYLGVHYPGDLLVGAILGSAGAYLLYCVALPIIKRLPSHNPSAIKRQAAFGLDLNYAYTSFPTAPCDVTIITGVITFIFLFGLAFYSR